MRAFPLSRRAGFSVGELLVVLAVLLILLGLLAPVVQRVRNAAMHAQSTNNLKQLALAVHNAHDAYNGMPPIVGTFANKTGTLHMFLLPFLEQQVLYNAATEAVWDNDTWGKRIEVLLDPRDTTAPPGNVFQSWLATTNYPGNWMVFKDGNGGVQLAQIPDGTSNTLMYGLRYQVCNGTPTAWGYPGLYTWAPMIAYENQMLFQKAPGQTDCDPSRPQAIGGTMTIAMCDGSVRSINQRVSAQTWANVLDPADGMVLGNDLE
jgi:type II secretory pathway pseudopilin PulG